MQSGECVFVYTSVISAALAASLVLLIQINPAPDHEAALSFVRSLVTMRAQYCQYPTRQYTAFRLHEGGLERELGSE